MGKRVGIISVLYLLVVVLMPPLVGWTEVAWRNATVLEFAREFTNLIPLQSIVRTIHSALEIGRISDLIRFAVQILLLLPVGVLAGVSCKPLKNVLLWETFALATVYGIRLSLKLGSFDVDDILMNLIGVSIGWYIGTEPIMILRKQKK